MAKGGLPASGGLRFSVESAMVLAQDIYGKSRLRVEEKRATRKEWKPRQSKAKESSARRWREEEKRDDGLRLATRTETTIFHFYARAPDLDTVGDSLQNYRQHGLQSNALGRAAGGGSAFKTAIIVADVQEQPWPP